MSTFIEIRPEVHATKKTTFVRIDDDLKVSIRNETAGVATDTRLNFTGMDSDEGKNYLEGSAVTPNDVIAYVNVTKLDAQERATIAVRTYYADGEADTVPAAGLYWYNTKNQYAFGAEAEQGKTEADNPNFGAIAGAGGAAQRFSTTTEVSTIFNISTLTAFASTANSVSATAPTARSYAELGNTANRRAYLKEKLRNHMDHPDLSIWIASADLHSITSNTQASTTLRDLLARPQSYTVWLQMMAAAVSIDANLDNERKFNLLNGDISLRSYDIFSRPSSYYGTSQVHRGGGITAWLFHRFGNVGSSTPWAYTAPSGSPWAATRETLITLATAGTNVSGLNWINYLRS